MKTLAQPGFLRHGPVRRALAEGLVLGGALLWAYWPELSNMADRWATDSRYAHGYLVIAFALVLLWLRRSMLTGVAFQSSYWWGVGLVALGAAMRLAGAWIYFDWLDMISLLPCLAGVFALVGGRGLLRWAAPAVAFLGFMVPLPWRLEMMLGWPLQRIATEASTYVLQTFGFAALSEGNIILMDKGPISVVEACSGLSMLVLFFAISTGMAMLIRRPWLDRVIILLSAIPIALISNIARITVTGALREVAGEKLAHAVFHDFAGLLMMPLALALLCLELWLLGRLLVEPAPRSRAGEVGSIGLTIPGVAPGKVNNLAGARKR